MLPSSCDVHVRDVFCMLFSLEEMKYALLAGKGFQLLVPGVCSAIRGHIC